MIELIWDQKFKKNFKKKISKSPELIERFKSKIKLFEKDPFNSVLRTHELSGILKGYWAFSIDYDLRVIFMFINKTEAMNSSQIINNSSSHSILWIYPNLMFLF